MVTTDDMFTSLVYIVKAIVIVKPSEVVCIAYSSVKPDSHRKIVKDYRPKKGKDYESLRESV